MKRTPNELKLHLNTLPASPPATDEAASDRRSRDFSCDLQATTLQEQLPEFIYYSFVTLNTLGYGDISPVGSLARTLAILKATLGIFYIAILVASLVGMEISTRTSGAQNRQKLGCPRSDEDGTSR